MEKTITSEELLRRLREKPELIEELVSLFVEEALSRPVAELIDCDDLASRLATGFRQTVETEGYWTWVEDLLRQRLENPEPATEPLSSHLPAPGIEALKSILSRPVTPSPRLVRTLADHQAVRDLLRNLLQNTLTDFGNKLWSSMPDTSRLPGAGMGSRFLGVAKGVASKVGGKLERQLDDRVQRFVDEGLGRALNLIVERATDQRFAPQAAAWRADLVDALLQLSPADLQEESQRLDPARLTNDFKQLALAFARWDSLEEEVSRILHKETEQLFQGTLRDYLQGSDLEESWRPHIEAEMQRYAQLFVESDPFAQWLEHLCAPQENNE